MRIIETTVLTNVNLDGLHLIVGVGIGLNDEFERFAKEEAHLQKLRNVITHWWQAYIRRGYTTVEASLSFGDSISAQRKIMKLY